MLIQLIHNRSDNAISIRIEDANHLARWVSDGFPKDRLSTTTNVSNITDIERFIAQFEKEGNGFNERGAIYSGYSPFVDCITIQFPKHLKALFTKIKDDAEIDKETGQVTITSEQFNSIKEGNTFGYDFKSRLNEIYSEKTPRQLFLDEHERLLTASKKGLFRYFRNTNLDRSKPLDQILQYAKDNDNRSRQACINLGWMKKDGTLNNDNPDLPQEVSEAYKTIENSSNKKGYY